MCLDLWLLHGPMYGFLHKDKVADAEAAVVVYGERISHSQLNRHKAEQELISGRKKTDTAMAMDMVRSSLLRMRTRYNDNQLAHDRAAAEREVQALESRAGSKERFEQQLASQGYTRQQFTDKVEARLMQLALLDRNLAPHTQVDDTAIQNHYNQIKDELTIPANRQVKHIFITSLNRGDDAARSVAEQIISRLNSGEEFAKLAASESDDSRSAAKGGDLGTIYDAPQLPLPELNLFGDAAIPADTLTLAKSKWGWHIILAGPINQPHTPTLEECRETLRTAIISAQRELGVSTFFDTLIKEAHRKQHIQIHVK